MTKIKVMNRVAVQFHKPKKNSAIIRIDDKAENLLELDSSYKHTLELGFYDTVQLLSNGWNRFSLKDAEKVVNFFDIIGDVDELVVHCSAGISRSPAIAIAYGWYKQDEKIVSKVLEGNVYPNMHVLRVMADVLKVDKRKWIRELETGYEVLAQKINGEDIIF